MAKFSFAVPVLPGKRGKLDESVAYSRSHIDEYTKSRERAGITMERASVMQTPMGEFVIPYVEGSKDFNGVTDAFRTGGEFDQWFLKMNSDISGIDFTNAAMTPPEPEMVAEWIDPAVTQRKKGIAFCAPFAPGKTEQARAFAKEAYVTRRAEFQESRRAVGVSQEIIFLNRTPNGDIACVYIEGDDPQAGNRKFAESRSAYDVWFKEECKKVFIPEIDFNEPLPPITVVWDWEAAKVAR